MAGALLHIQLTIANAAEVKADLTPVFQDIDKSMLNVTRKRFNTQTGPDGTPSRHGADDVLTMP
jgi:hypothetical protein